MIIRVSAILITAIAPVIPNNPNFCVALAIPLIFASLIIPVFVLVDTTFIVVSLEVPRTPL